MTKPITFDEASAQRMEDIPDAVVEVFNILIKENLRGSMAVVLQRDAVSRILAAVPTVERGEIFDRGWLDVEPLFRQAGWGVVFDKPGYNETYEASFKFTRGTKV